MTVPVKSTRFLSPVKLKEELPEPEEGLMAFDLTHSIDGRAYFWMVENGEWLLKEIAAPVCAYCGR